MMARKAQAKDDDMPTRSSIAALLDDVDDSASAAPPAVDKSKIAEVAKQEGFTSREGEGAKPKKRAKRPTAAKEKPADALDPEVEARLKRRKPGRRSAGLKVQFNARISPEAFAKVDKLAEDTGMTFGAIMERAIDLVDKDLR